MVLQRVKVSWSGDPVVGPGVTVMHAQSGSGGALAGRLQSAFQTVADLFPEGLSWSIPNGGDTIDEATGQLVGTWGSQSPAVIPATGVGAYAKGVGARAEFITGAVRNGRRVRGSAFLVPLLSSCYDVDGTLTGPALLSLSTWASQVSAYAVVFSRPKPDAAAANGGVSAISGSNVADTVSWLRSRRT